MSVFGKLGFRKDITIAKTAQDGWRPLSPWAIDTIIKERVAEPGWVPAAAVPGSAIVNNGGINLVDPIHPAKKVSLIVLIPMGLNLTKTKAIQINFRHHHYLWHLIIADQTGWVFGHHQQLAIKSVYWAIEGQGWETAQWRYFGTGNCG